MTGGHPLALPPVNHTAPVPRRIRAVLDGHVAVDATITAPIDAGELRLDISERGLPRDTAAIHERAEAGDLRGRRGPGPGGLSYGYDNTSVAR